MRWNNLGIGYLDQLQYADAIDAFEQVIRLRPDYKDGYINLGLTYIEWEKYDEARATTREGSGTKAERCAGALLSGSRRTTCAAHRGRNGGSRESGRAVSAIAATRAANLGISYYQQHRADDAMAQFKALQAIDPDDLAAHYNLAILYRRKGMKQQATDEALAVHHQANRSVRANVFAGLSAQASRNFQPKACHGTCTADMHTPRSELQAGEHRKEEATVGYRNLNRRTFLRSLSRTALVLPFADIVALALALAGGAA